MTSILRSMRDASRKRKAYQAMVAELQSMSDRDLYDVGIHRSRATEIAREAVYGA
jgi:uncharacterized protein YjiS (DUF1127 family)